MNEENNKSYVAIDIAKLVFAMLVLYSHTDPFMSYGITLNSYIVNLTFRLAVPFFFLCSGYFFFLKKNSIVNFSKRIFILYFSWFVVYVIASRSFLVNKESIKLFFLSGNYGIFWYFPALVYSTIIVYLLKKYTNTKTTAIVVILFYILGLLGDTYFKFNKFLPITTKIINRYSLLFQKTRNGFLFPPLYIFLGSILATKDNISTNKKFLLIGFIVSYLFFIIEYIFIFKFKIGNDNNFFISLVPAVVCLFLLLKNTNLKNIKFGLFCRKVSIVVYCSHYLIYSNIAKLLSKYSISINSLLYFLISAVVTLILSSLFVLLSSKVKELEIFF